MSWSGLQSLPSKSFTCGHCGNLIASVSGYAGGGVAYTIYICPHCKEPTYFHGTKRIPGVAPGEEVKDVPTEIAVLYREARSCVAAGANTAAVLLARKLLMNIAVAQQAPIGKKFIEYVEYLASNGYVPPNGKGWVDHIRTKGNEAAHEIHLMAPEDAEELIVFIEMLLKFIYEFPNRIPAPSRSANP